MSSDPEQEYFSDGMTEEILNRLAKIPGLEVAARTSVFSFKGQNKDIREMAGMLGVSTMLEGSVRRDGEQVRITAQLIRASDGFHLWSETYDRKIDSIFAVQDEISEQIAAALQVSLGILQPGTSARQVTNPEVYDLYLRARALFRQRGRNLIEALNLFQRAVEIDPEFAPAWAGLAHTYTVLFSFLTPEEINQFGDTSGKSMDAAQRALALDPHLPTALHAMANNLHFQFRWLEADEYFQKAIALDPDSTDIMEDYAHFLVYSWQNDKAGLVADRMIELDPFVPIFRFAAVDVAQAQGDYQKRDEHIRVGLQVNPGFSLLQAWNLRRLLEQKRFDEAREYTDAMDFRGQVTASGMRQLVNWVEGPASALNTEMRDALSYSPELALLGGNYPLFMNTVWAVKILNSNELFLAYMLEFAQPASVPWSGQLLKFPQTKGVIKQSRLPDYWRQVGWPSQCHAVGADDFECE
jgi:TolB-like protein